MSTIGTSAESDLPFVRSTPSLPAACAAALAKIEWRCLWPQLVFIAIMYATVQAILRTAGLGFDHTPDGLTKIIRYKMLGVLLLAGYIMAPLIGLDMIRQMRGLQPTPFHERISCLAVLLVCGSVLALLFIPVTLINGNLKPAIPLLNSIDHDVQLEALERSLCGGILPTEWLVAHMSRPILEVWATIYNHFASFLLLSMMIGVYYEGLRGGARLLLAISVGLFITLMMSVVYPSRGPLFVHAEWFDVMADSTTMWKARFLEYTVRECASEASPRYMIAGISAMPSFHVIAWTCGLMCWRPLPKWVFAIGVVLVTLNWISTFVLGWHYVLDGVVGIAIAALLWPFAAIVIRRKKHE